jgi:hypothetical protein
MFERRMQPMLAGLPREQAECVDLNQPLKLIDSMGQIVVVLMAFAPFSLIKKILV